MRFPIKRISLNAVCFFSNGILLIKGGIFSGSCQQDMSTPNKIRNIVWGKETPTNGDVPVRKTLSLPGGISPLITIDYHEWSLFTTIQSYLVGGFDHLEKY